jgi:L-fuculose-phosphate aldolase
MLLLASLSMPEEELIREREAVAAACRELAADGLLIGTAGNVSARAGELVAITATGAKLAEVGVEEVSVIDLDGDLVAGELEPTSELDLHLGVYRRFEHAGAVVHTHAPVATALSCVVEEIPCVHYQMLLLGGTVPVAPYRTFGTPELAEAVLEALEGHTAALMANHGAIVYGADVDQAVELSRLLEWSATVYWRARVLGDVKTLDSEAREAVVSSAIERGYGRVQPAGRRFEPQLDD